MNTPETSEYWKRRAEAAHDALQDLASYLSVGIEGCQPNEAIVRIKEAFLDFVRPVDVQLTILANAASLVSR